MVNHQYKDQGGPGQGIFVLSACYSNTIVTFVSSCILEVVGGVGDGSPPRLGLRSGLLQLAIGFGAVLHYQARSLKKCIQAV